jgi:hypothetical protein
MALSQRIPQQAEAAIASYSYLNILERIGYASMYGAVAKTSAGTTYLFTGQATNSAEISTILTDADFDMPIMNASHVIKGYALFSCGLYKSGAGATVTIQVKRVRDGVVTNLTDAMTSQTTSEVRESVLMFFELPRTTLQVGDLLRITITNTGKIGVDPAGREDADGDFPSAGPVPSTMRLDIGFEIDL